MKVVANIITAGVAGKLNPPGSCHIWFVGSSLSLCINELVSSMACAYTKDSKSVCASVKSDQSLSFQPEETLDPWLHMEFPSQTLISLCICTG